MPTIAPSPLSKYFKCQQCGAEVATDPSQRSYVCPFCDSTYVMEFSPQQTGRQPPEFVIGFAVTPEQAHEAFKKWLGDNSWFRPGDLATASIADKMKGIYLPFWAFTMLAQSQWQAQIGEHWYRTETYTERDSKGNLVTKTRQVQETEWWPLAGRHHRYYSGYLVSGSKGLAQDQSLRIQPFQLPALKRYEPYFLAGWLAEEYSVERDAGAGHLPAGIPAAGAAEHRLVPAGRHTQRPGGRDAVQQRDLRSVPAADLHPQLPLQGQALPLPAQRPDRQAGRRQTGQRHADRDRGRGRRWRSCC